jgi:hypothetical protein
MWLAARMDYLHLAAAMDAEYVTNEKENQSVLKLRGGHLVIMNVVKVRLKEMLWVGKTWFQHLFLERKTDR